MRGGGGQWEITPKNNFPQRDVTLHSNCQRSESSMRILFGINLVKNHLNYKIIFTCRQMATFTLHPKLVETARGLNPRALNNFEKLEVKVIRGLSSATTTQVLTQAKFTPRCLSWFTEEPRPLVHSSMTPERNNKERLWRRILIIKKDK